MQKKEPKTLSELIKEDQAIKITNPYEKLPDPVQPSGREKRRSRRKKERKIDIWKQKNT